MRERHPGESRWADGPYGAPDARAGRADHPPAHHRPLAADPRRAVDARGGAQAQRTSTAYTEAEIVAARAAACYMGVIETPEDQATATPTATSDDRAGRSCWSPVKSKRLRPGEKFNSFNPNRPNSGADPFLRFLLREIAAGVGVSYEGLSRDYSQSNYSSSRLALIDDRDLWRTLQPWFIRSFRDPLHREWMPAGGAGACAGIHSGGAIRRRPGQVPGRPLQAARLGVDRPDQGSQCVQAGR
ncbi:MAG: phage portal protein [Comamonadaceae bacterium]|nr:phage portal protein [Comamonadaceae bacterium]